MKNTPRYVISLDKFRENCLQISDSFIKEWGNNVEFGYSVKTNREAGLIKYANKYLNWNIEVVSPDEYRYCKTLGIKDSDMILNGPCKEVLFDEFVTIPKVLNLDNYREVEKFIVLYPQYDGLVGLRVNFDLESKCPGETTAGKEVSRFGIDFDSEEFKECINMLKDKGIINIGLHLHTSTTSRSLNVFSELAKICIDLKRKMQINFCFLDIGGGFFGGQVILGKPTMEEYAKTICDILKMEYDPKYTKLILEPGASTLATCVTYETRIINKRKIRGTDVLTVDGSLLHINPFMLKRKQPFDVLNEEYLKREKINMQIVGGATCMENDRLATIINSHELCEDDILSFKYVGAYTMGLNSNFILRPPQVDYLKGEEK